MSLLTIGDQFPSYRLTALVGGDLSKVDAQALVVARVLDNPKAANQHAAAAKVLSALLDELRSASAQGRRGRLAVVRTLTEKGGA